MSDTRKMHGLWRFHRAARKVVRLGARWWIADELDMTHRLISAMRCGYGRGQEYSNADAISRCAIRYIRIHKIRCVNVKQWNAVVLKIAARAGYTHPSTIRSITLAGVKNARLDWANLPSGNATFLYGPHPKWSAQDVEARLVSIKTAAAASKNCRWCGAKVYFKPAWLSYDNSIRCNSSDCRRLDYLQHKPQSRGGIDLTPTQRAFSGGIECATTMRLLNYAALITKEIKHGRKSDSHVR